MVALIKLRLKHHYHFNLLAITAIAAGLTGYAIFRIFFTYAAAVDADINGDKVVDVRDLAILAADFRKTGQTFAQGDLSGGGIVDLTDYSILAVNWGLTSGGGGGITDPACTWPGIANQAFPCAASTGLPAGTTLTPFTGSTTITSCQTIDHKLISGGLDIEVTNGNAASYSTEAAAKTSSCVILTNDKIVLTSCGTGCNGIDSHYASYACPHGPASNGCGPVFVADTTIITYPPTPSATGCSGGPCTGVGGGLANYNWHAWRTYISGGTTAGQCGGDCDLHDSVLIADHGDLTANISHMDGFISNGNDNMPLVLGHNTLICGSATNQTDCSAPLGLFSDSCCSTSGINDTTVNNNYFAMGSAGASFYCNSTADKTFGSSFVNVVFTNNVYDMTCSDTVARTGIILNWYPSQGGDKWCNNKMTDGTRAHSNGGAPPPTDSC